MIHHVMPLNDLREHEVSPECWCKPSEDDDAPGLWVHNSMDRREHTVELGKTQ